MDAKKVIVSTKVKKFSVVRASEIMSSGKTYMDTQAAARIQANEAKANQGGALKDGFAGRAQAAAAANANTGKTGGAGGGSAKK